MTSQTQFGKIYYILLKPQKNTVTKVIQINKAQTRGMTVFEIGFERF